MTACGSLDIICALCCEVIKGEQNSHITLKMSIPDFQNSKSGIDRISFVDIKRVLTLPAAKFIYYCPCP